MVEPIIPEWLRKEEADVQLKQVKDMFGFPVYNIMHRMYYGGIKGDPFVYVIALELAPPDDILYMGGEIVRGTTSFATSNVLPMDRESIAEFIDRYRQFRNEHN